jgi:hypothetical protein
MTPGSMGTVLRLVKGIRRNGLLTPCVTSGRVYVEVCPGLCVGAASITAGRRHPEMYPDGKR